MGFWDRLSDQLSRPSGRFGRLVAAGMNRGNRAMNAAAIERLGVRPGDRVLDLGFGGGLTLQPLLDAGAVVTGCDRSHDMIAAARSTHPDATIVVGDVAALPFVDHAFDAVLSVNTVYFWRDLPAALLEIRRVMAPGGHLVLGVRDPQSMRRVSRDVFTIRPPAEIADVVGAVGFTGAHLDSPAGTKLHFVTGTA